LRNVAIARLSIIDLSRAMPIDYAADDTGVNVHPGPGRTSEALLAKMDKLLQPFAMIASPPACRLPAPTRPGGVCGTAPQPAPSATFAGHPA
jgi:hypothetical protein